MIHLPYVNLQPSIPTSINTCLRFAAEECRKRQQRCFVTFDLPLFFKAMDIVSQEDETAEMSKAGKGNKSRSDGKTSSIQSRSCPPFCPTRFQVVRSFVCERKRTLLGHVYRAMPSG
ncbi:hypothetical protein AVEN_236567-1 [Araneus ventricosus]|uniref:Uncharacterized protein n=1 Tax=Araneus ventricosus TaxID=182803 RepID=A0A4Y2UL78_ARAVE|nr:hypothetical protein AVEN_236567-1 [Araneus ventricosus]